MQAIATPMTQVPTFLYFIDGRVVIENISEVKKAMKEWTKIFPKNMTETYTSSVTFMKQLTVVAISTITYLKNFPEDSYTLEHFAGLKLRILKKKCRDEFADFVSTALTQAFEAFDKKYLHQLALCFYKDEFNKENLLEYHIFEYSYTKDGVSMSVHSKGRDSAKTTKFSFDNVRDRTVQLIRACVVIMQSTQHNCDEYGDVSLRLYYNEDAPPDYNVPGFACAGPEQDHVGATLDEAIKLGCVETPFHRVTASSYIRDDVLASREALPSQNAPMMTQVDEDDFGERQQESPWEEGARVRCPCHRDDEVPGAMLTCFYCNTQQHAACFGVSRDNSITTHCCDVCADRDPARCPTDQRLAALPDKKRECMCIFRRTLEFCQRLPAVRGADIACALSLSRANAGKLLKLLHSHDVIDDAPADLSEPKKINSEQLHDTISKFFQTSEDNLVDRLLAETFASQETPDPVGEVLDPMEKVSLHNTDTLGRVIDNPVQPPVTQDSTLQQYREAVLSNYQRDEELPLSGSHNPVKDMESIGKKLGKRKINDENQRPRLRSASHKTKRAKMSNIE